jgi:ribonucleoside-diphosphate reductase alpha chain
MKSTYRWLTDLSQLFLDRDYLVDGQTLDQRVDEICHAAENLLKKPGIMSRIKRVFRRKPGFAAKFKSYIQKGWYSLSTPIWTNFGNDRGLPISCFGSYIADDMESIVSTWAEVAMMTKHGGGTSAYFGELRRRGAKINKNGESSGSVHFMQAFDMLINIISQGKTRRGNFAAYLNIDHPDAMEFLTIRADGSPIQDLSFGVCVPDYWMEEMIGDGTPEGGDKQKRKIWAKVLEVRANLGFPYIVFIDTVNNNTVDCYKDKGLWISHSNLCSEIMLPDGPDESFVCDLSSMNILYYDEWKDTDAVELLVYFLDAVMTEFIEKASKIQYMHRAVRFAKRHRALGIGQIGWHSYLQSKMIPFESMEAKFLNVKIARTIKEQAYKASEKMAKEYGEPDVCKGYGRRNSTLIAIAPTKSSAFILGQASEGIEPHKTNYFIKDLQKGKFTVKNQCLEELLIKKGMDAPEVWDSILKHGGSVQHLDFLDDHEKAVFKTFGEISPKEVIIQAAQRQKYIDQSQSLNIMIHPSIPTKDVNALMIEGWRLGVKSYYYQYSVNAAQAFSRNILSCASCEG